MTTSKKRSLESILKEITNYSNLNKEDMPTLIEHIKDLQEKYKSKKEESIEEIINSLSLEHKVEMGSYGDCGYVTITLSYKDKVISSTDISGFDIKTTLAD